MSKKLYVGNLSWDTTEDVLNAEFSKFGTVAEVNIITDRDTGRPRGFAFVTMGDPSMAQEAIQSLDGTSLDGRNIRVNIAEDKRGGGGGGGGGGRGRY